MGEGFYKESWANIHLWALGILGGSPTSARFLLPWFCEHLFDMSRLKLDLDACKRWRSQCDSPFPLLYRRITKHYQTTPENSWNLPALSLCCRAYWGSSYGPPLGNCWADKARNAWTCVFLGTWLYLVARNEDVIFSIMSSLVKKNVFVFLVLPLNVPRSLQHVPTLHSPWNMCAL